MQPAYEQVCRPAKEAAKFLEERAAAARLEGEMNPATSEILRARDDNYTVIPFGLHKLTFDSTLDEIRDAIGESHFAVEVRDPGTAPRNCIQDQQGVLCAQPGQSVAIVLRTVADCFGLLCTSAAANSFARHSERRATVCRRDGTRSEIGRQVRGVASIPRAAGVARHHR